MILRSIVSILIASFFFAAGAESVFALGGPFSKPLPGPKAKVSGPVTIPGPIDIQVPGPSIEILNTGICLSWTSLLGKCKKKAPDPCASGVPAYCEGSCVLNPLAPPFLRLGINNTCYNSCNIKLPGLICTLSQIPPPAPASSSSPASPSPYCGDNACNNGENCSSCSQDCGQCQAPPVPVNGGWSGWSGCSATVCGTTGTQMRTCNNPAPSNGGANCAGASTQSCSALPCCSPDCSKAGQVCAKQKFTDANNCGTNNCEGTRSCDYNWKEVAP